MSSRMVGLSPGVEDDARRTSDRIATECLAALRSELTSSYPTLDIRALRRILRSFGRATFPAGMLLPPGREITSLRSARQPGGGPGAAGDLFSAEFYRLTNPDVQVSGVSPWLHYQVFGRPEGRSPHPLIDISVLAQSSGGVAPGSLVDDYLEHPEQWLREASPYVECRRFALSGRWNGAESPLSQIVRESLFRPWVHSRLILIDAGGTLPGGDARVIGAAYLLGTTVGRSRLARIESWSHGDATAQPTTPTTTTYTVIPGWFLGTRSTELHARAGMTTTPDTSAIRLAEETLSVVSGPAISAGQLVYTMGPLPKAQLVAIVDGAAARTVVAPWSAAQETALRQLRRDRAAARRVEVLPYGSQVRVTTKELRVEQVTATESSPAWNWEEAVTPPNEIAFVLPEPSRKRSTGEPRMRAALAGGAGLCLVDDKGLNTWLPILQSRSVLVVDPSLLDDVASFVDAGTIRVLPARGGSGK